MYRGSKKIICGFLLVAISSSQLLANEIFSSQSRGISLPSSLSNEEKKEALIVGVSDYARENADLDGIDKDVAKMKNLFSQWGFKVTVLYDKESMQVVEYLNSYAKRLSSRDLFAFYYTGHGSHKVDESNDEADRQDETLVLSDGKINKHLIDDILYQKFNNIKAKKLVFFDACHSGTVFRTIGSKTQTKAITPEEVTQSFKLSSSKGISMGSDTMKSGDFVTFSSSRDTEESLATPTGSLFTNAINEVFSDSNLQNKSLNEIKNIVEKKVLAYAKETDGIPHHPNINYSTPSIGTESLQRFIQSKSSVTPQTAGVVTSSVTTNTIQSTFENMLNSNSFERMTLNAGRTIYRTGESVEFTLDTKGVRGYLTLFYVDKSDVTLLYPNPFVQTTALQGRYRFPQDLANGQFELEAYKSCHGCDEEATTIYALLTFEPISDLQKIQNEGLKSFKNNSYQDKVISRAVRVKATKKSNSGFRSQLGKYNFLVK